MVWSSSLISIIPKMSLELDLKIKLWIPFRPFLTTGAKQPLPYTKNRAKEMWLVMPQGSWIWKQSLLPFLTVSSPKSWGPFQSPSSRTCEVDDARTPRSVMGRHCATEGIMAFPFSAPDIWSPGQSYSNLSSTSREPGWRCLANILTSVDAGNSLQRACQSAPLQPSFNTGSNCAK